MSSLTFEHYVDPQAIMVACGQLYQADLYDPHYGIHDPGLLFHYGRAHNEGETSLVDLWVAREDALPVGVVALDRGLRDVLHLYVAPLYRRLGIGRELLRPYRALEQGEALVGYYTRDSFTLFSEAKLVPTNKDDFMKIAIERNASPKPPTPAPVVRRLRIGP
jgi:GNAT superfamily N-acetyltransferase